MTETAKIVVDRRWFLDWLHTELAVLENMQQVLSSLVQQQARNCERLRAALRAIDEQDARL